MIMQELILLQITDESRLIYFIMNVYLLLDAINTIHFVPGPKQLGFGLA